jgi:hypothetical protein
MDIPATVVNATAAIKVLRDAVNLLNAFIIDSP